MVPCSARHLERVLLSIDRARPERTGELGEAIVDASNRRGKSGLVALISDLYVDPEELRRPINHLREAGNDIMVFHLLDPAERDLPYEGKLTVEDMETGETLPLAPEQLREEYRELVNEHVLQIGRVLAGAGADHVLVETSRPLDQALFHYLLARQHRNRSGKWASLS